MQTLPQPHPTAQQQSLQLTETLCQQIATQGAMPFEAFMQAALYTPSLGYYSGQSHKFGAAGDFVTAPEISPLFSFCLAHQCQQILSELQQPTILEFGAGLGNMAADILQYLDQQNALPEHYYILELSADLQTRQKATLEAKVPHLLNRVSWLNQLPDAGFEGVILANEVLDAMPVVRFRYFDDTIQQGYIDQQDGQLCETWQPLQQTDYLSTLKKLEDSCALHQHGVYESEFNPQLNAWISSLSDCLEKGLILLIDYGFPQHEYYHPDRRQGTLMCHYRHHAHNDVLWYPGLQDITAHVDFTAVAEAADDVGLQVAGYTDQASFLIACGLLDIAQAQTCETDAARIQLSQQIQKLTMPSEMGELFKVMALTRELDNCVLAGFQLQDKRHRL